jgi:hypothetical protein
MHSEAIVPASFHGSDAKAAMIGAAGEAWADWTKND